MALQESTAVRNAALDAEETSIGASAVMKLFSGAVPANCAAADPAGLLATLTLPADWMANASGGSKALAGVWSGAVSSAGTALSFRLYASDGTTCGYQGTVGQGSGDLSLDNSALTTPGTLTISTFTLTKGNA